MAKITMSTMDDSYLFDIAQAIKAQTTQAEKTNELLLEIGVYLKDLANAVGNYVDTRPAR